MKKRKRGEKRKPENQYYLIEGKVQGHSDLAPRREQILTGDKDLIKYTSKLSEFLSFLPSHTKLSLARSSRKDSRRGPSE